MERVVARQIQPTSLFLIIIIGIIALGKYVYDKSREKV